MSTLRQDIATPSTQAFKLLEALHAQLDALMSAERSTVLIRSDARALVDAAASVRHGLGPGAENATSVEALDNGADRFEYLVPGAAARLRGLPEPAWNVFPDASAFADATSKLQDAGKLSPLEVFWSHLPPSQRDLFDSFLTELEERPFASPSHFLLCRFLYALRACEAQPSKGRQSGVMRLARGVRICEVKAPLENHASLTLDRTTHRLWTLLYEERQGKREHLQQETSLQTRFGHLVSAKEVVREGGECNLHWRALEFVDPSGARHDIDDAHWMEIADAKTEAAVHAALQRAPGAPHRPASRVNSASAATLSANNFTLG